MVRHLLVCLKLHERLMRSVWSKAVAPRSPCHRLPKRGNEGRVAWFCAGGAGPGQGQSLNLPKWQATHPRWLDQHPAPSTEHSTLINCNCARTAVHLCIWTVQLNKHGHSKMPDPSLMQELASTSRTSCFCYATPAPINTRS